MDATTKISLTVGEDELAQASDGISVAREADQPFEAAPNLHNLPDWVYLHLCSGEWE